MRSGPLLSSADNLLGFEAGRRSKDHWKTPIQSHSVAKGPNLPTPPEGWMFSDDRSSMVPIPAVQRTQKTPGTLTQPFMTPFPNDSPALTASIHHGNGSLNPNPALMSNANQHARIAGQCYNRREKLLQAVEQAMPCSLCWLFGDNKYPPGPFHRAFTCPWEIIKSPPYATFKAGVRFDKGFFLCYVCCIPHLPPFDHPKGSQGCTFDDVIKPIAFLVFSHDELRAAVFSKLGLPANYFDSINSYKAWLGQIQGTPGALYNIHEVLLAYHDTHPFGGCGGHA